MLTLVRGESDAEAPREGGTHQPESVDSLPITLGTITTPTTFRLSSGKTLAVSTRSIRFEPWGGEPIADTYGGKALVNAGGKPLFAELAVLQLLQKQGWDGRWVDTYRAKFRTGWPDVCPLPPRQQALFDRIVTTNGERRGCWDVFAWRGDTVLFVECKRIGKDRIRDSQVGWLDAALAAEIPGDAFLVAEWNP